MKRWRFSKLGRIAVLSVFLVMSVPFTGAVAASVEPVLFDPWQSGNAEFECEQAGCTAADYAYKIEGWGEESKDGTYEHEGNTITISNDDGYEFDWASEYPVTCVIVVRGNIANVYYYGVDGAYSDTDLTGPTAQQISHVTFCFKEPPQAQKDWEFTAPADFAGRGYDYKAYYSEVDPADEAFDPATDWVEVALTDDNGVWKATTYHDPDTVIWWKWVVYDGMDVIFETGVYGPETLTLAGSPHTNDFQLCLKKWLWSPPELLTLLFDEITLSAWYSLDDVDYDEVPLEQDEDTGDFYAETVFECGTEIWYYFVVSGSYMGTQYYTFATEPAQETITDGLENAFVEPRTLKTFELTACVEPDGGTYYAAWSLTGAEPWYEVELEEIAECVYSGDVNLFQGLSIYWKFYDDSWSTVVLGPETLEGANMVNRWERTGVTRTIGYWQTHPCMTELVFDSIGGEIDICWTTLDSIEEVMAVLNWPQMEGAPRLSAYRKAVLQTSRQLVAATLNEGLGSTMPTYNGMSAKDAFCDALDAKDLATIIAIGEVLDEFNNSGTEEWLPEWTWECWVAADPMTARALGAAGWDAVKADLPK
jgi:hypothetical protein